MRIRVKERVKDRRNRMTKMRNNMRAGKVTAIAGDSKLDHMRMTGLS